MPQDPDEPKGFTVVDRRHGRESGEEPAAAPAAAPPPPPPAREMPPTGPGDLPAIDFSTFLISLSTSALYHLGLVSEQEGAPPPPPDLPMARQTIELIEMLQAKTRGNLDAEEAKLLESLLYELRMRFVDAQRRA
jgi:hypothetical protein